MALDWKTTEPVPDVFEASVGDTFLYVIHYAISLAESDDEIRRDLSETVYKALPYARAATGDRAIFLLLLWDAVYCNLTIVCSDESMMYDSQHVTKCEIHSLERVVSEIEEDVFDTETEAISLRIENILKNILNNIDENHLPNDMPILYSAKDRATVGDAFTAKPLI